MKRPRSTSIVRAVTMTILVMTKPIEITRIEPAAAIPGAEISIQFAAPPESGNDLRAFIDGAEAHPIATSLRRMLVNVPANLTGGEIEVSIGQRPDELSTGATRLIVGKKLADGIHPVANPAFDPADGSLYVTRSGSRGEHVPVSLYRINSEHEVEEVSGDIQNPTGIAFSPRGQMFVTSRLEGTVYRVSALQEASLVASELGIATGIAFSHEGEMFVGDRGGVIFRVNEIGEVTSWVEHEPSVSAYHLAFGPDGDLYVAGPTVSSFDVITRFDKFGNPEEFFRGLGRPQGLAFDVDGNLYVAASLRGSRGVVKIARDGDRAELLAAGMNVVGLAFGPDSEMIVATNDSIYSLALGIEGLLLSSDWALTRETP
jgi:sugar lactone lactonase YvrE